MEQLYSHRADWHEKFVFGILLEFEDILYWRFRWLGFLLCPPKFDRILSLKVFSSVPSWKYLDFILDF
jgi:hypothetical protein